MVIQFKGIVQAARHYPGNPQAKEPSKQRDGYKLSVQDVDGFYDFYVNADQFASVERGDNVRVACSLYARRTGGGYGLNLDKIEKLSPAASPHPVGQAAGK